VSTPVIHCLQRKQLVQKTFQQRVWLLSLRLRLSGSFNATVIASIRASERSWPKLLADWVHGRAVIFCRARASTCTHTHEHRPNHSKAYNNSTQPGSKVGPTMDEVFEGHSFALSMMCTCCNGGCSAEQLCIDALLADAIVM